VGVWRLSLCVLAACSFTPGTLASSGPEEAGVGDAPTVDDATDATTADAGCATSCDDNDPCTVDACAGTICTNTALALPAGCGSGALFSCAGGTTCFARCPTVANWTTGEALCAAWSGHLATTTSDPESACIGAAVGGARHWIGLVQLPGGTFEPALGWGWSSGTISIYTNWILGQPNNNTDQNAEGQDCGFLEGAAGEWYDHECGATDYPFVCER